MASVVYLLMSLPCFIDSSKHIVQQRALFKVNTSQNSSIRNIGKEIVPRNGAGREIRV